MSRHEVRHIGPGMKPYNRNEVEPRKPPRAVWTTYPRRGDRAS